MNSLLLYRQQSRALLATALQLSLIRRIATFPMQSDMCFQILKPPSRLDIDKQLAKEKSVEEKLRALIKKRECVSKKALEERQETVHVLESMKDRYVVLLRQRKMISRAITRRTEEMRKLKRLIGKKRKLLHSSAREH